MLDKRREIIFVKFNNKNWYFTKVKNRNLQNMKNCRPVPTSYLISRFFLRILSKRLIMLMKKHLNVSIGNFYLNFLVFTHITYKIMNIFLIYEFDVYSTFAYDTLHPVFVKYFFTLNVSDDIIGDFSLKSVSYLSFPLIFFCFCFFEVSLIVSLSFVCFSCSFLYFFFRFFLLTFIFFLKLVSFFFEVPL